jgi:hypothetical protein
MAKPKLGQIVMTDHSLPDQPVHPAAYRPAAPRKPLSRPAEPVKASSPPPSGEPIEGDDEEMQVAESPGRAQLVDPNEAESESQIQADEEHVLGPPSWAEGFEPTEVEKVNQYKSDEELKKAYLHLQRKIGDVGKERAGLEAMVKDILAQQGQPQPSQEPVKSQPYQVPPAVDWDKAFAEVDSTKLLDDPQKVLRNIAQVARDSALHEFRQEQRKADEEHVGELMRKHNIASQQEAAILDAMASLEPGRNWAQKYDKAIVKYNEQYRGKKPLADAQSVQEAEAMKAQATHAPATASGPREPKIYTRKYIWETLTPEQRQAMWPKFEKAYREGRVR